MRRHVLPVAGNDPAANGRSVQRALDGMREDVEALDAGIAYSPSTPSDWSGSPPTTIAEALDRIAAALGPIP